MSAPSKPIPLHLIERLSYNPETGEFRWKEGSKCAGQIAGSVRRGGYRHIGYSHEGKYRSALAHRVAWLMHYGEQPPEQIDHINRNRADNRIANLRAATPADNARHRGPIRNATHKGVTFDPTGRNARRPWRAYIHVLKKRFDLGRYATEEEARAAYRRAARERHGEFASWQ